MPPPPPPPPPGPPPPGSYPPRLIGDKAPKPTRLRQNSRQALLNSIHAGTKLKSTKHLMSDRSAPDFRGYRSNKHDKSGPLFSGQMPLPPRLRLQENEAPKPTRSSPLFSGGMPVPPWLQKSETPKPTRSPPSSSGPPGPPPPMLIEDKAPKPTRPRPNSRDALLNSIHAGTKLKSTKHLMVDKSGPDFRGTLYLIQFKAHTGFHKESAYPLHFNF